MFKLQLLNTNKNNAQIQSKIYSAKVNFFSQDHLKMQFQF